MKAITIYFDMDGTIADLYNVDNWKDKIENEDVSPYIQAKAMWDMDKLEKSILKLQDKGFRIGIITWLAKNSTQEYKQATRAAKREWLKENLSVDFDEIHMVQYGTPKHQVAKDQFGIIIDDDSKVRKDWIAKNDRRAVNPEEIDIIKFLMSL